MIALCKESSVDGASYIMKKQNKPRGIQSEQQNKKVPVGAAAG